MPLEIFEGACLFVVYGATGDLMARKLLPALFNLADEGQLPKGCHVRGMGRRQETDDLAYRAWALAALGDVGANKTVEARAKVTVHSTP